MTTERDFPAAVPLPDPSVKERAVLRSRARNLEDHLRIGKSGLEKDGVVRRISSLFSERDLLKLRFEKSVRAAMPSILKEISERLRCTVIQTVGRVAVLYRPLTLDDSARIKPDLNRES